MTWGDVIMVCAILVCDNTVIPCSNNVVWQRKIVCGLTCFHGAAICCHGSAIRCHGVVICCHGAAMSWKGGSAATWGGAEVYQHRHGADMPTEHLRLLLSSLL
jgi:hypothetical protein